jgi:hypothetical protein
MSSKWKRFDLIARTQDEPAECRILDARAQRVAQTHRDHPGGVVAHRLGENVERAGELGERLFGDRPEDRLLGIEMVVEAALRDVGGVRDVLDGAPVHPLRREHLARCGEQGGPGSKSPPVGAVLGLGSSHARTYSTD